MTFCVNALRPDGLCALNSGTLVYNHCIKHSKPFVIPVFVYSATNAPIH